MRVTDKLVAELGDPPGAQIPGEQSGLGQARGAMHGILNREDEALVAQLRRGLARVAAAVQSGAEAREPGELALGAVLDGTELVMRGELMMGNASQLPALLPGFVFLVALPLVDQDPALELSRRCELLVQQLLA